MGKAACMRPGKQVVVALVRPAGYEDVHAELLAEDAMDPAWPWDLLADQGTHVVLGIHRPENYERTAAETVAKEAIRSTWPWWHIIRT